jgi:hypothetical protein
MATKRASKTGKASQPGKSPQKKKVATRRPAKGEHKRATKKPKPLQSEIEDTVPGRSFIGPTPEHARFMQDRAILREYFNLKSASEIAHLAALLGVAQDNDRTPESLVALAAELHGAADTWLHARRQALAALMGVKTLEEAVDMVGAPNPQPDTPMVNRLLVRDPVAAPLIERLLKKRQDDGELFYSDDSSELEHGVAASKPKKERPILPCSLKVALLYITADETLPDNVLLQAFNDCLLVSPTRTKSEYFAEQNKTSGWRLYVEGYFAHMVADLDPGYPGIEVLKGSLEPFRKKLRQYEDADTFRANFKHGDGDKSPKAVKDEADKSFALYWKGVRAVNSEAKVGWLADHFQKFWKKHGEDYRKHHKYNQPGAEEKRKKCKESGALSAIVRERTKWLDKTQRFILFARNEGNTRSPHDLTTLIREFSDDPGTPKTKDAREKQEEFLGTLCNPGNLQMDENALLEILKGVSKTSHPNKGVGADGISKRSRDSKGKASTTSRWLSGGTRAGRAESNTDLDHGSFHQGASETSLSIEDVGDNAQANRNKGKEWFKLLTPDTIKECRLLLNQASL